MTNAELITSLRWCGSEDERHEMCVDESYRCPMWNEDRITDECKAELMRDAADALEAAEKRIAELEALLPKEGEWIMDENPHDGDCRCSVCLVAIDAMHERNHGLLNALTGGKWWKFYRYCPNCGAKMKGANDGES